MRPSLWKSSLRKSKSNGLRKSKSGLLDSVSNREILLREELDVILYGDESNIPHGHFLLIRHMRRDSSGQPIYCVCKANENSLHPSPSCSYCNGEGYLWDEQWHIGFSMTAGSETGQLAKRIAMPPGIIRTDYRVYFLRFNCEIKYGDKIVEIALDYEGKPLDPIVRKTIYAPQLINEYRSDYGRLEYIAVSCREEDAIRPDQFGV